MASCVSSTSSDDESDNFPSTVEAFTSLMKYADWMGQLTDEKKNWPLKDLALPGSHDSGTYKLDLYGPIGDDADKSVKMLAKLFGNTAKDIIYRWAVAQDFTFTDQLWMGVRYFDLRVSTQSGKSGCYLLHSLFGISVEECLTEISEFLDKQPTEVVLLDFNHFYDMTADVHTKLIALIKSKLSTKLCPDIGAAKATLNALTSKKQQAIVFYQNAAAAGEFWPKSAIPSPWPDTDSVATLIKTLTANYELGRPRDSFYVTQGVLTPGGSTIFKHLCKSLRDVLSKPADVAVEAWLQDKCIGPGGLNIVIADFIQYCQIIPILMSKNGIES